VNKILGCIHCLIPEERIKIEKQAYTEVLITEFVFKFARILTYQRSEIYFVVVVVVIIIIIIIIIIKGHIVA
jgi:phage pi2 protein 07